MLEVSCGGPHAEADDQVQGRPHDCLGHAALPNGGWVTTHTDVTEQFAAEQERDALRQREEAVAPLRHASPHFVVG